eukprot:SAG31_NODE_1345_length_8699_cov_7.525116_8_plen_528_part_00
MCSFDAVERLLAGEEPIDDPIAGVAAADSDSNKNLDADTRSELSKAVDTVINARLANCGPGGSGPEQPAFVFWEDMRAVLGLLGIPDVSHGKGAVPGNHDARPPVTGLVPVMPDLLPDLCVGPGGRPRAQSTREAAQNRIVAIGRSTHVCRRRQIACVLNSQCFSVLNRLAANALRVTKSVAEDDRNLFWVAVAPDRRAVATPGELLGSLDGAEAQFQSTPTTFAIHLSLREQQDSPCANNGTQETDDDNDRNSIESYRSIGWCALATTSVIDPVTQREITTIATHGGLRVTAPMPAPTNVSAVTKRQTAFEVQCYQGLEGFSGWHADNHAQPEWLHYVHVHGSDGGQLRSRELCRACDIMSAQAAASNLLADKEKLPLGGYGVIGVCTTSAAVGLQALYPNCGENFGGAIRHGPSHQRLALLCGTLADDASRATVEKPSATGSSYAVEQAKTWQGLFREVQHAVFHLPEDTQGAAAQSARLAAAHLAVARSWRTQGMPFEQSVLSHTCTQLERAHRYWAILAAKKA